MLNQLNSTTNLGTHQVPAYWKLLLPSEFFELSFPQESASTCNQCPEVACSKFRVDYRCCTFQPRISNFALGFILLGHNQFAQDTVHQLIKQQMILPEGFIATPLKWQKFLQMHANDEYGKSRTVLCEFLDKIHFNCSIYQVRNATCSTFFCRHDQNELGEQFWDSLMIYINQGEHILSQWCMSKLGIDVEQYFQTLDASSKNFDIYLKHLHWPEQIYKKLWGNFLGNEADFLIQCAQQILAHKNEIPQVIHNLKLLEAFDFHQASQKHLPFELQDEIDPLDIATEGCKSTSLAELYKVLRFDLRELNR